MKYTEYREAKKHGSDEFPLQYYLVNASHPQYIMPLHWHGELEIIRVIEGELALWLNNEKFMLSSGDLLFVDGGALHRGEPKNCSYECAVFDPKIVAGRGGTRLSELVKPLCSGRAGVAPTCEAAVESAGKLLDVAREGGKFFELKLASLICDVIYILYSEGAIGSERGEDKRTGHRRAAITLLLDMIEKNYTEKITLAQLAELAGMSEKYLCRFFKAFTGYTPTDYINRLRVERA